MAGLASINVRLGVDIKQFSSNMRNATRKIKRIGMQMKRTGQTLTRTLSLPIAILGGLAVKTFADFEQSMAKVKAVSGATAQEFAKLEKNAMELGASTRFTASQVAELQLNYSKLGFSAKEIVKVTEATLDLALATGEELARSAEVAGVTLRGFDLAVEETGRIVDVMAASFSSSALDLEKFAESMKFVAPIANTLGISIERTTAFLATMADAGISGSMAGTSLRMGFIKMKKAGLSLNTVLQKLVDSNFDLNVATELVGVRAATAFIVLAKGSKKIERLTDEFENSAGAAKIMAKIMDDTLKGALFKVKSALEAAGISIGKTLMPLIKKLANFVIKLANSFGNLNERTKKIILAIVIFTAALGPLLVIFGFLMTTVIPGLIVAFRTLMTTMASFGVIPIIAIITGIVLAIRALGKAIFKTKKETVEFNKTLIEEVGELNALFGVLKSATKGSNARTTAIKTLNEKYKEYLPNLLTEKSTIEDISKAQLIANKLLIQEIAIKSQQQEITKATTEAIKSQREALEKIRKEATKGKGAAFAGVAVAGLQDLKDELLATGVTIDKFGDDVLITFGKEGFQAILDFSEQFDLSFDTVNNAITDIIAANKRQSDSIKNINGFYNAYIQNLELVANITKDVTNTTDEFSGSIEGTATKTQLLDQRLTDMVSKMLIIKDILKDDDFGFSNAISDMDEKLINFTGGTLNRSRIAIEDYSDTFTRAIGRIQSVAESMGNSLGILVADSIGIFVDSLKGLKDGAISVGDVFKGILGVTADFLDSFGRALIVAAIATDAFKKLLKFPLAAVIAGLAMIGTAALVRNRINKGIEGRALGGPVTRNTPFLVGEVGPELFIPSQAGNIIPNSAMGGNQGGTWTGRLRGRDMEILIERSKRLTNRTV